VAEVFIQPGSESGHTYKEIEVSPNGNWLDLALTNGKGSDLNCDMKSRASIDVKEKVWTAELAIPVHCLTGQFDPKSDWRVNFFRIEGLEPRRFYSAWHATKTLKPNFHVPEAFGILRFSSE
jgi:alpha-galactosidase